MQDIEFYRLEGYEIARFFIVGYVGKGELDWWKRRRKDDIKITVRKKV
jgi:hypothetical protein